MVYHVIVNPGARSGRGVKIWRQIRRSLRENGDFYRVYPTQKAGDARELAGRIVTGSRWSQEDVLVILGGDGTLNEAVDGLPHLQDVTLGYIPAGSGNDFARSLGIPKDPLRALEVIRSGAVQKIRVGRLDAESESHRFLSSCGVGYDAEVCCSPLAVRLKQRLNRMHLGKLAYLIAAIQMLIPYRTWQLVLSPEDGGPLAFFRVLFVAAMNTPYEGGGFRFCPDADPSDERLDVMVVENLAKWKILLLLPLAFFGLHTFLPQIHIYQVKEAELISVCQQTVHRDGEEAGRLHHLRVSLEEEPLSLLVPAPKERRTVTRNQKGEGTDRY